MTKTILTIATLSLLGCVNEPEIEQSAYDFYRLKDASYVGEAANAGVYLTYFNETVVLFALIDDLPAKDSCSFTIRIGRDKVTSIGNASVEGSCRAKFSRSTLLQLCSKNTSAWAEIDSLPGVSMELMCTMIR